MTSPTPPSEPRSESSRAKLDAIKRDVERMLAREDMQQFDAARRLDIAAIELAGVDYVARVIAALQYGRGSRGITAFKAILQRSAHLATGTRKLLDEHGIKSEQELADIVRVYRQATAVDKDQRVEIAYKTLEDLARSDPDARDRIYQRVVTFTGGAADAGGENEQGEAGSRLAVQASDGAGGSAAPARAVRPDERRGKRGSADR